MTEMQGEREGLGEWEQTGDFGPREASVGRTHLTVLGADNTGMCTGM